jgi:hypothetical protein
MPKPDTRVLQDILPMHNREKEYSTYMSVARESGSGVWQEFKEFGSGQKVVYFSVLGTI